MSSLPSSPLEVAVPPVGADGQRTVLGEGPVWVVRDQVLLWVDIKGQKLHVHDPSRQSNVQFALSHLPGCVAPRAQGGAVVALSNGFGVVDYSTGAVQWWVDPEHDKPENRFNDGACDPKGRFFAGTLQLEERDPHCGALYCLEQDHSVRKVLDHCTIPNGIVWSLDGAKLYFIDTPTRGVDVFDYDVESGAMTNRTTVIKVPEELGHPDGMTIDAEGMLWVAHWGGGCVTRWDPRQGSMISKVVVPVSKVTSCAFGGKDLEHLYISTASVDTDTIAEPLAGALFILKTPGVRGRPEPEFAG